MNDSSSECIDVDGERRLWRHVILQLVRDISDAIASDNKELLSECKEDIETRWFGEMCDLADLDPVKSRRMLLEMIDGKTSLAAVGDRGYIHKKYLIR